MEHLKFEVSQSRFPQEWLSAYHTQFRAWKDNQEIPPVGTPILTWPVATPAQQKSILSANIRTVEDLAQANAQAISAIGIGGVALVSKAKQWLEQASNSGKLTEKFNVLESEIASLKVRNESLENQNKALASKILTLEGGKK